jgi:cysteine synthase
MLAPITLQFPLGATSADRVTPSMPRCGTAIHAASVYGLAMARLGLEREIVDRNVYERTVARFRDAKIVLPTIGELSDPSRIAPEIKAQLKDVDPDSAHPLNLFRVHWYNDDTRRGLVEVPRYVSLPSTLTGVKAKILVAFGNRFPMIAAHKVLAAYGCLVPRLVTGQFDPTTHRAVWPSTGNYCRGGVAISRILGCHGVAVLPAGMSEERFAWLDKWCLEPKTDIVRTPGTESNVKEIYDECARIDADPHNIIFNQFCEFGNYLVHLNATGRALQKVFEHERGYHPNLNLAAFTSATGSAGTLAAGDWLKEQFGTKIVAVEASECPTLLRNGYGEHNIQGIGDKHVPYIHNVMNTDLVVGVSDHATDALYVLFNTDIGRAFLQERHKVSEETIRQLSNFGFSGICNVLAAIKTAKQLRLGPDDAIVTVATDGSAMYGTEKSKAITKHFGYGFDQLAAAETYGRFMLGASTDDLIELDQPTRERIFNLGYFTWVEQQGVALADFDARKRQSFWKNLRGHVDAWDAMIGDFNAAVRG